VQPAEPRRESLDRICLGAADAVLEAAVVGRPDDVLGEVVVAYIALRPEADVSVDELYDVCAERLAKYKRPVTIEVLETLPKNAVGKIDKPSLRRLAAV
jgi:long-chain acyl-CoA synthetase